MPTLVTKTIGASGRDYATIQAFFDAAPSNLVTVDEVWEGVIYPDSGNTIAGQFSLGAKTTDATRFIRLKCAAGASFKDHVSKLTNALRPNASNGILVTYGATGSVFSLGATQIEVVGLQVLHTAAGASNNCFTHSSRLRLIDCLVQSNTGFCASGAQTATELHAYNTVFIARAQAIRMEAGGTATGILKGCTVVGTGQNNKPFDVLWRPLLVKDTAWFGFLLQPTANSWTTGSSGNATDLTSFPNANVTGTHSLTYANQFENNNISGGTHDFRVKAGSNLIGAGVADADIAADIVGTTRLDPPTIGAWDYISSGPTATDLTVADLAHAHSLDVPTLTPSGSTSLTTADLTHAHAIDGLTLTVSGTAGSITVQAVKSWPGGALQANVSDIKVFVNNETTGALVYASASVTTNGSGDFTVSDAAIVAGDYSVRVVLPDGSRGEAKFTVA